MYCGNFDHNLCSFYDNNKSVFPSVRIEHKVSFQGELRKWLCEAWRRRTEWLL